MALEGSATVHHWGEGGVCGLRACRAEGPEGTGRRPVKAKEAWMECLSPQVPVLRS